MDTATGCRTFGAAVACPNAQTCSGGVCQASCTNQCTAGAKQCASTGAPVECLAQPNGCTDWKLLTSCAAGQTCSGGTCASTACTNQCTSGATRCTSGGRQQSCGTLSSGCTEWSLPVACVGGQTCAPTASACAVVRCTAGEKRCSGTSANIETCDVNGNWLVTSACPQACSNAQCTAAAACQAGTVRCNGTNVESCNAQGTAWLYNQTCNVSCTGGLCGDPCTAGAKRCNGAGPEVCNAQGTGWTAMSSCMNGCYLGDCVDADLIIDGVTTTLEGDHKYANSVIIRNQGQLRVGPSGVLKIRARTISVESNTTINANDLGDDTRGEGVVSQSQSCTYLSSCTFTANTTVGSSYGTLATASPATLTGYCSTYGGNRSCGVSSLSSSIYDRDDDLSISEGSKLGTVKGGGLVQLIAESVTIDGQITSNATAGGASGGGVLIAANQLTGTGVVQTTGGTSPAAGNGRVKLLHGVTSNLFSGTVVGNRRDSAMPPLDLVSGSHPNPDAWYNDGLGDWYLAWTRPFPTLTGYYLRTSTSDATLPSNVAGNGTFHQSESFVVPAAQLVQGTNYFHLVSVDSGFNVGTVKATAKANINTVPPSIASPSHPAQRTWNGSNALALNWTNPRADSNFTGYYSVLDTFADTLPPTTQANFTTNKQVILANVPNGIWVFHLLNRDTRGATTKVGAHYVVYVGAEPVKENLSGSVFDGSANNAPISGATITINRGLFGASSAANGTYTFAGNLYVGAWEVTVSKPGYTSVTSNITLVAGSPLNQNFTLMRAP